MELSHWIHRNKNHWITIADIVNLPLNQIIKLLMLDQNIYDDKHIFLSAKLYKPKTFFKNNYVYFMKTNQEALNGKIQYSWNKSTFYNLNFDIESKSGKWNPLINGFDYYSEKHWTEFDKKSYVGFRGPMIFWDTAIKLNDVYKIE